MQAGDRDGWLALMTDDVVIEDPIGPSVTNPDGNGVRGKEAVAAVLRRQHRPEPADASPARRRSRPVRPTEIAYILVLQTRFPNGFAATVRGVFTYGQRRRV